MFSVYSSSLRSACPTHPRTRFSHKSSSLHSLFSLPCASRGKLGTSHPTHNLVFQIRSFAQPRFRKLTPMATSSAQTTSPFFPLFLVQLRVLLSFFLIITAFLTTRRFALLISQTRHRIPRPLHPPRTFRSARQLPRNPDNHPVFHPHRNAAGEYNQEEENRGTSARGAT